MCIGKKECLSLLELKYDLHHSQPCCLLSTLLWLFRDRLSTHPRDKVYALFGLPNYSTAQKAAASCESGSEPDLNDVIIDYDADLEAIYASLVKAIVFGTGQLDIICANEPSSIYLRSWVPNWAEPWARFSLLTNNMNQFGLRNSSQKPIDTASASRLASATFSQDLGTLSTAGISWGRIIHPPHYQYLHYQSVLSWLMNSLLDMPRHIQESMSSRWHEMARKFRRLDIQQREKGFQDLSFHQLTYRRRIFVDERAPLAGCQTGQRPKTFFASCWDATSQFCSGESRTKIIHLWERPIGLYLSSYPECKIYNLSY
jgi:hypothetical protein